MRAAERRSIAWYPDCTRCTTVNPANGRRKQESTDGTGTSAVLVVTLDDLEQAMTSRILDILAVLDVSARTMPARDAGGDSRRLSFRIPRDRVPEVLVALGHHGFRNLRVYETSVGGAAGITQK